MNYYTNKIKMLEVKKEKYLGYLYKTIFISFNYNPKTLNSFKKGFRTYLLSNGKFQIKL